MSADTAQFTVRSELFAFAQGRRCGMVNEVRKRGVRDFFSAVNDRIGLVVGAGLVLFFFRLRERSGPSGPPAGDGLASQGHRALAAFNVEQTHAAAVSDRQRWIDP